MTGYGGSQPVWVRASIVKEKLASTEHENYGSGRRFHSSRSNGGSRNARSSDEWGWFHGFATMNVDVDSSSNGARESSSAAPRGFSRTNGGDQIQVPLPQSPKTSPFGQVKLRKTQGSVVQNEIIRSPKRNLGKRHNQHPSTIVIQDQWNEEYNGVTIEVTSQEAEKHVLQANSPSSTSDGPPKNLIELTHLHEPSLIQSLRERYDEGNVYTFCGKILLALNPFREIEGLYSDERMKQHRQADTTQQPHAYAIAHEAFASMKRAFDDNKSSKQKKRGEVIIIDQSILISGESGAGKTVTTKIVMQYLAKLSEQSEMCRINPNSGSMERQVLLSNPILESFGNARTVRNDNSSRFGKFIEIQFHRNGCLMGAKIKTYLLEKVRLIRQAEGERNYHIFYELLSGLKSLVKERKELHLQGLGVHDFKITADSGTYDRRDGVKDSNTFASLRRAMETVGISSDVFQAISGLLHMSNLSFVETREDSVMLDERNKSLEIILSIFGVDLKSITNALCKSKINVGSEVVSKNLSLDKAEKAKEALMKATYSALFDHIVTSVNNSITVGGGEDGGQEQDFGYVKLLDIFGFESFGTNSFEQLCINYCNESLQQQFNRHVFKLEQQEYERENIAWSFISFPDNQDVLDLIEKKHSGIFSILDEQCRLAKCTDHSFVKVAYEKCEGPFTANRTQQAQGLFSVKHYAGEVEYNAETFLDKNKDELPKEATDFLLSSTREVFIELGNLLSCNNDAQKKNVRSSSSLSRASVASQFSSQLRELRDNIDLTTPHYIRCLKPNDELVPENFVPVIIADQLRCAGVLEAVRVSRVGYPQRYSKDMFVQRYGVLSPRVLCTKRRLGGRNACDELVDDVVPQIWERQNAKENDADSCSRNSMHQMATFDLVSVGIQLGKSKVFLRHHAFETLEFLRSQKLHTSSICLQAVFRMSLERKRYHFALDSALKIQSQFRRAIASMRVRDIKVSKCAILIQSAWREFSAYSAYSLKIFVTLQMQKIHRGNVSRRRVQQLIFERKAIVIQSFWRMFPSRNHYLIQQYLAFNLQQCFRNKKARGVLKGLRMEAKDLSHVANERDKLKKRTEEMEKKLEEANRFVMEAKKVSTGDESLDGEKWRHWRSMYEKKDLECKAKDAEIMRLKEENETLHSELHQRRSLTPPTSRSVVSESIVSSKRLLNSSMQSLKWGNSSLKTSRTDMDDSWSADTSQRFQSNYFDTPIHRAIRAADDDALSIAVSNCDDVTGDINRSGRDGRTPLHLAILNKNLTSAEFLLQNDSVACNTQDDEGNTPLHHAKDNAFVKLLLGAGGANPNIPNGAGFCAIHVAVQRRDVESVRTLVSHSANLNAADDAKWLTPLHLVAQETLYDTKENAVSYKEARNPPVLEIAKLICSATHPSKADLNFQDKGGNSPLHHLAVLHSRVAGDLISLFLRNNADTNVKNERGQTPMHLLMHNKSLRRFDFFPDLIQLMLFQGCDTNIQSMNGCTPLHLAIYHQDIDSAIELMERESQLHVAWQKPARWEVHWQDCGSSNEVYALDMVENRETMHRLLSSITCEQKFAPPRSNCMQCKRKISAFGKKNCFHCGSLVCARCSPQKLDSSFFPPYCRELVGGEDSRVCIICEEILTSRKEEQETIMGREVFVVASSRQEEVSMLDMECQN